MKVTISNSLAPDYDSVSTSLTKQEKRILDNLTEAAVSDNTQRTYLNALKQFLKKGGMFPTTSRGLSKFIAILTEENRKASTIESYVRAISQTQEKFGFPNPYDDKVATQISGLKKLNRNTKRKGDIFTPEEIFSCLVHLKRGTSQKDARNSFLFTLMLWTGCRTEEITNLDLDDVSFFNGYMRVYIKHSKTDGEGEGETITLPRLSESEGENGNVICPVASYENYRSLLDPSDDSLFRRVNKNNLLISKRLSKRSIREIVKQILINAGIEESRATQINGHSFRHTIATLASSLNINLQTIQKLGRWKSTSSLEHYSGNHTVDAIRKIGEELGRQIR